MDQDIISNDSVPVSIKDVLWRMKVWTGAFDNCECEHGFMLPDCPNKGCEEAELYKDFYSIFVK
jgi:hypothetical protein